MAGAKPRQDGSQGRLSSSSIATRHMPSQCDRRVWLREASDVPEAERGEFSRHLAKQGMIHEERIIESFRQSGREVVDLGDLPEAERIAATAEAVRRGSTAVICQGQLVGEAEVGGQTRDLVGRPDFLIFDADRWVIADAKLTRTFFQSSGSEKKDKRAVFLQMRLYGWLFQAAFPGVPFDLHIHDGKGEIQTVVYREAEDVFEELELFTRLAGLDGEPYEQVGLSKCGECGFKAHCWPQAKQAGDIGLLPSVDKRNGPQLRAAGIDSVNAIAADGGVSGFVTGKILEEAQAVLTGKAVRRGEPDGTPVPIDPAIASDDNYVMFDLEGVPPDLDQGQAVYLWGMQVFGKDPGPFLPVVAGFGDDGDREGWLAFLSAARSILNAHPGIRWVHWHHYEKSLINAYIKRYGDDSEGTAAEVIDALLDLFPITKKALALPIPGYSLKLVEKLDSVRDLTGFSRSDGEVGKGDESIVVFTRAAETDDDAERERLIKALCDYNHEDLEATWAVQQWLRSFKEPDQW